MLVSPECIKATFHITGQRVAYDTTLVYRQPDFVQVHGSCFLIQWEDKKMIIMTNAHVTDNGRAFNVISTLIPNHPLPATLRSFVPNRDLSLVQVDTALLEPEVATLLQTIKPLAFATEIDMKIGEQVAVIGFPLATRNIQTSQGVITGHESPGNHANSIYSSYTDRQYFQTDAAINAGNSGGPVINVRNEVVGVASAGINTSINFVIPSHVVTSVLRTMLRHAFVYMPSIGINLQPSPLGAAIIKIYSHSIFCRTNWTYEAKSMQSYAKQVDAKKLLEGSGRTPAQISHDAQKIVANLYPTSTPVVTQSDLQLFDIVEGITIVNNGKKLDYHIDDHGLVKDEGFLVGAFLTEINDMIDYGTQVTLHVVRKGNHMPITVKYVTPSIVTEMARPAYITIEPKRFNYLFQYGLLLHERAHYWLNGDSLLMGVGVSAVLRTSIADTYEATREDSMILTLNEERIYTLVQFLQIAQSIPNEGVITIKFSDGSYLIATGKQLEEDDKRLLGLYNIPAHGRIMAITR